MIRERKLVWGKQALSVGALLTLGLAFGGAGCADSGAAKAIVCDPCAYEVSLPENTVAVGEATQIDVNFCFNDGCRDAVIDLVRPDGSSACTVWLGSSSVCLLPSAESGIYSVSATWDHRGADANGSTLPLPTKPADGSRYVLTLRDHATNAVLLARTSQATYADLPDPDGWCHRDCWSAQSALAD